MRVTLLLRGCLPFALILSTAAMSPGGPRASLLRAYERSVNARKSIPAFARKYSLPCSACHTVWPELNPFGQAFRDNGFQLGNDRDSPIWQNPAYWPIAVRTTPQFHLENTTKQPVDAISGDSTSGLVEKTITQSGVDISGIDFLMLGTLYKNITFGLTTTMDPVGATAIEAAYVRFDNLGHSGWANLKVGKFELDNLLSEKRVTFLSNNSGGFYAAYHFLPVGDANDFGLGDNQIGVELSGHSLTSYTRYGLAVLSSTSGTPGLPRGRSVDAFVTLSQAYDAGSLGLQRLGLFAYLGQRSTVDQTTKGVPIPGAATGNKPFYRIGATGSFFFGHLELLPLVMHASDNAYLGTATPANQPLPAGAQDPTWNAIVLEAHYFVYPQLLFEGRYQTLRMSKQADPATPKTLGNNDGMAVGIRAYPFMFSRAGLSLHGEFAVTKTVGTIPLSGDGAGVDPLTPGTAVWSRSLLLALDFAF
ncbi:MAG TPA: hypothetical protein VN908_06280 [Gemmatimonadales bacterium]|nr:hypothetical protein [Gemmatimonadales bacterium]